MTQAPAAPNGALPNVDELAEQWQEEAARNLLRMRNFVQLMANPDPPPLGISPRQEIYRRRKARLYRYEGTRTHAIPLLFVPNLGISRPYIFDLMPGSSFVEHLAGEGFDFYLLDWGEFGPEDNDLTFEYCVTKILPRVIRKVRLGAWGARLATGGRQVDPEPLEELVDPVGEADPAGEAGGRAEQTERERLQADAGQDLRARGAERPQHPELARALGDGDRERVEDLERAHEQRHSGEHE